MRKLTFAIVMLLAAANVAPAPVPSDDTVGSLTISAWHDLNAMCRGGHSPESEHACCVREKVSAILYKMGYCYRMGERWVKCRPTKKHQRTRLSDKDCVH